MSPEEALRLCRMTKALMPAMQMDEFTPAAWAIAFEDDRYADAEQALKELAREKPFVGVSEIAARVKRIRSRRIEAAPHPVPPADLTEAQQRAWIGEARRRIADGEDPDLFQRNEVTAARPIRELAVGTSLPEQDKAELRDAIRRAREAEKPEPTYTPAPRLREPEPAGDRPTERKSA